MIAPACGSGGGDRSSPGRERLRFGRQNTFKIMQIEDFAQLIPNCLRGVQGAAFYAGRSAFEAPAAPLYILGLNPAGSFEGTLDEHTQCVLNDERPDWSSYLDGPPRAKCSERPAPKSKIRKRMSPLLGKLGLVGISLRNVPASNLFFRSSSTSDRIERRQRGTFTRACWPFHEAVVANLNIRVVVCLSKEADRWVRKQMGASERVDEFVENNDRKWRSWVHKSKATGRIVIGLTHPSRAHWTKPETDPTGLVVNALKGRYD